MRLAWQEGKRRGIEAKEDLEVGECRFCRWTGVKSSGVKVERVDETGNICKVIFGAKIEGPK